MSKTVSTCVSESCYDIFVGEESTSRGAKNKRKRSEPRDPNAPKRPSSAYIYFSTEMRLKIREEKQEMSMSERAKYIGKLWAAISKEEKKVLIRL